MMFPFFQPIDPPRRAQVMAHRSIMTDAPENTLPGFQQAIDRGVEWIETDVRLTRDGHHVILHDSTLDRTTNGAGPVEERTLDEIRQLDAGSWFSPAFAGALLPTLTEILDFCRDRVNLYLDCKRVNTTQLAHEILDADATHQVIVFDKLEALTETRSASDGRVPVMPSINKRLEPAYWINALSPEAVEIHAHHISETLVEAFHASNVIVQAQTLNDRDHPEMWQRCLDLGVDWIQTDCAPDVITLIEKSSPHRN